MEIIGLILMGIGGLLAIVGGLWMLIEQFKTGILWGIACIIIPFISLIWLVSHWEEGKTPFLIGFGGGLLMLLGTFLGGGMESVPVQ